MLMKVCVRGAKFSYVVMMSARERVAPVVCIKIEVTGAFKVCDRHGPIHLFKEDSVFTLTRILSVLGILKAFVAKHEYRARCELRRTLGSPTDRPVDPAQKTFVLDVVQVIGH